MKRWRDLEMDAKTFCVTRQLSDRTQFRIVASIFDDLLYLSLAEWLTKIHRVVSLNEARLQVLIIRIVIYGLVCPASKGFGSAVWRYLQLFDYSHVCHVSCPFVIGPSCAAATA